MKVLLLLTKAAVVWDQRFGYLELPWTLVRTEALRMLNVMFAILL